MTFSINPQVIIAAALIVSLFIGVQGHSYVTSPQSRSNQKQTQTGCRGPNCLGPCEVSLSRRSANAAVHTAARGSSITVQWPRNNHAGGFIRFAWAPTVQSDNHTIFDQHVQQISCHETGGCFPDDSSNPNGGDSGPGDGSSRACSQSLTVPADLADGLWTLQWAWFGGAFSLGDYYSCIDYRISGGASGSTPVPKFVGGDYTYPGQQKCKFFNTDRLHVCVNEPCNNPLYTAASERSGAPAYVQQNFPTPATPTTPTTPTTPSATSTSTTGAKATPTTSTSAAVPVSSTTTTTTTTGTAPAPATSTSTSSSSSSCVSGYMKCLSDGSYSTCNHGTWASSQSCGQGTSCSPNGNYIYCLPIAPISTPTSPSTPTTPSSTTSSSLTSTSSTSSSSTPASSCTLGYQQCVGSNSYKTCGNGRDGPLWLGVQYCQTGLNCHASATANNIYCY